MILQGIRILDFTRFAAGAFSTRWLAALGADVAKVEPPGGEAMRQDGWERDEDGTLHASMHAPSPGLGGFGPGFVQMNLGKRSISIDMRAEGSLALVQALIEKADVLIESFTPHVFPSWGLSYEEVRQINPEIIYVSASGFGSDSANPEKGCIAPLAAATAGLMYMTGEADGYPLGDGFAIADPASATVTALGVLAAIIHKLRTGEGQFLDTAMVDSVLALDCTAMPYVAASNGEFKPNRTGKSYTLAVPLGTFALKGEYLMLQATGSGAGSPWDRLCKLMGREDLVTDPRFLKDAYRWHVVDELWEIIEDWLDRTFSSAEEAATEISKHRILAQKVYSPNDLLDHPHYASRGTFVDCDHPLVGPMKVMNMPLKFSRTPVIVQRAPLWGEHNEAVLSEWLGFDTLQIEDLYSGGVLDRDDLVEVLRATGEIS